MRLPSSRTTLLRERGRLISRFRVALAYPPWGTARIATTRLMRIRKTSELRRRDRHHASYALAGREAGALSRFVEMPPAQTLTARRDQIEELAGLFVDHRFDLLGSGWVEVRHGMACPGLEGVRFPPDWPAGSGSRHLINMANRSESELDPLTHWAGLRAHRLAARLQDRFPLVRVHLVSRHQIREHPRSRTSRCHGNLGRLQHLPQLALAATLARANGDGAQAERLAREFQDQVLDFIAANPPRFGVQWAMTMDVAIRAANLLLAWDIFRAADVAFDSEFMRVFSRSAFEHGQPHRHEP